jgi:8-oxo-dGTP pyrophosphatase MutT (NUDIX family)
MESEETKFIINKIKAQLKQELPGDKPRSLLAPFINGVNQEIMKPNSSSRQSAVLLLLWERNEKIQIVFTLRSVHLLSHSGQISFPGGKIDSNKITGLNETAEEAALRETNEEIGISPHSIEVLGRLSPLFVLPSNTVITPIVGYSKNYLDFKINHNEVEEVFTKPLDFFTFDNIKQKKWDAMGELIDIPYWQVHPSIPLWGATAMILAEFIEVYRSINLI